MKTKYTILNSGVNCLPENINSTEEMTELVINHNAGFFSCNTIALMDIVRYFNENKALPDKVNRSEQYLHYKSYPGQDLIPYYFTPINFEIPYLKQVAMDYDCMSIQFGDYRNLPLTELWPFIFKYFTRGKIVIDYEDLYEYKYELDYTELCGVFFRGNDKARETSIAPYDAFINKAKEIKAANPDIRFLVQPDETEFLEAFLEVFPDSIYFEETPHMRKKDSCMFYELPQSERAEYGAKFFAAVLALSQCKHLICHSGNCGLWCTLYRGNTENVHQYYDGKFYS